MESMKDKARCRACAADDADIGVFDHGIPHDLKDGCDLTERDLCEHGDGRVGNHAFHGKEAATCWRRFGDCWDPNCPIHTYEQGTTWLRCGREGLAYLG